MIVKREKRFRKLPPGPRMPSGLQAIGWARRPLPFLERCQRRYGDVFTLRVRHGGTWVLMSHPDDVKRVFTAERQGIGVGEANPLLGPMLGPRSVMLLSEPEHMTRRRLMLPPFHGAQMRAQGEMIAEVTRREVARWPLEQPFELWPRMQAITLEAVMRVVFGPIDSPPLRRLHALLRELTERMNDSRLLARAALLGPRRMVRHPRYAGVMARIEAELRAEMRRRRSRTGAGEAGTDEAGAGEIASMLCHARYEDGSPLSTQDLRDELVTLLLDGPTSSSLAWVFERLLRHPEKLARLRAELERSHREAGETGERREAPYLDAVVRETLRLCPPVAIVARTLLEPMRLGGYPLPAGTTVAPCIHLMHLREDLYPQPRSFLPERFLERAPGTYTWIPFGGGSRRCLAASFALQEMKRVTETVLAEVELQAVDPRSERVRRAAIAFSPQHRGLVIVTRRHADRGRPASDAGARIRRASGVLPAGVRRAGGARQATSVGPRA
jgi:cytochrome P450 family 135